MRDFRDAKTMARTLRNALKIRAVEITYSDCLELIAKAFGLDNWNVLSAKIAAAGLTIEGAGQKPNRPFIAHSVARASTKSANWLRDPLRSFATDALNCACRSLRDHLQSKLG